MEIVDRKVPCKVTCVIKGTVMKFLEFHGKMSFPNWFNVSSHPEV